MERVFIFIEEVHALLFAHHIHTMVGVSNVRLDTSANDRVVRFDIEPEAVEGMLEQYRKVKAMQNEKHRIVEVKRPTMYPYEDKRSGEQRLMRFKFKCTKILIDHPIGGRSIVTHILRDGKNKFTFVSPYKFKIEIYHPDNFRAWSIEQWGLRLTQQILGEIAQ